MKAKRAREIAAETCTLSKDGVPYAFIGPIEDAILLACAEQREADAKIAEKTDPLVTVACVPEPKPTLTWGEKMTDLEITTLCAKAMNLPYTNYDPLHDGSQAMQLVQRFHINICWFEVNVAGKFEPSIYMWCKNPDDLLRAICECVANMKAKNGTT